MPANQATEGTLVSAGLFVGRLLLALIFVHEGWTIIGTYSGASAYMQKFGVPGMLLPAVIVLELGGGLLIAAGVLTRVIAMVFATFCTLTAVVFHWQFADGNQLLHFQKDLAIAGGFLVLAVSGPGNWSVGRYFSLSSRSAERQDVLFPRNKSSTG
jgi:putative oxidoreductase